MIFGCENIFVLRTAPENNLHKYIYTQRKLSKIFSDEDLSEIILTRKNLGENCINEKSLITVKMEVKLGQIYFILCCSRWRLKVSTIVWSIVIEKGYSSGMNHSAMDEEKNTFFFAGEQYKWYTWLCTQTPLMTSLQLQHKMSFLSYILPVT